MIYNAALYKCCTKWAFSQCEFSFPHLPVFPFLGPGVTSLTDTTCWLKRLCSIEPYNHSHLVEGSHFCWTLQICHQPGQPLLSPYYVTVFLCCCLLQGAHLGAEP